MKLIIETNQPNDFLALLSQTAAQYRTRAEHETPQIATAYEVLAEEFERVAEQIVAQIDRVPSVTMNELNERIVAIKADWRCQCRARGK